MPSEPIPAAAGIIMSDEDEPRILLARRNESLRFMAGHHVFPGGRISDTDRGDVPIEGAPSKDEAAAIAAAAREIFEETGLLLAHGERPSMEQLRNARKALLEDESLFPSILHDFGMYINAEDFIPAGLWVTPPFSPIRFHTRYYIHKHRGEHYEEVIEGEIMGLDWLNPGKARHAWRQNQLKLSPPVAYVLQHLARVPYPDVLEPLHRTSDREPGLPSRIELRCGVVLIPLETATLPPATHTNCIVIGEDELIVIDPGADDEEEIQHLFQQLDSMLGIGERISSVIVTHSHADHIGAVERVRERYDVPVLAHSKTARQMHIDIDKTITHGDVLTVPGNPDWRLHAIHTPGHDPGHLVFLEETTKTLIGGDMVANPGTIVISPDYEGDMTDYIESIDRLIELEGYNLILPSHGMPIGKPKDKLAELKAHRLEREAKIKAAWDAGHRKIADIIPIAYDDTPEEAWPLAEHTLRAHLLRLGLSPE